MHGLIEVRAVVQRAIGHILQPPHVLRLGGGTRPKTNYEKGLEVIALAHTDSCGGQRGWVGREGLRRIR